MKKAFVLLAGFCLISISVTGQTITKFPGNKEYLKHRGITNIQKKHEPETQMYKRDIANLHRNRIHPVSELKSAQVIMQRLDSLLYEASGYGTYRKEEYSYDNNSNVVIYADYDWDYEYEDWIGYAKAEYTYNSNNNMTLYVHYLFDRNTSQWVGYWKEEYTNDAAENWIQTVTYVWNDTTIQWDHLWKDKYAYDENNNLIQMTTDEWNGESSEWVITWKEDYIYDDHNERSQTDYSYWYDDYDVWFNYATAEYVYDDNKNLTHFTYYDLNDEGTEWVASWNEEYTYDANNNLTLYNAYEWDESASEWILSMNKEATYDDNQNRTEYINFDYSDTTGYKSESYYDNSYSTGDLILPFLEAEEDFKHMLLIKLWYHWDVGESNWIYDTKITYYFSEQNVTNVQDFQDEIIKIYPNPANDFIRFEMNSQTNYATFKLYDLMGRERLSKEVKGNYEINIEHLNSGIYFYDLYINDTKQSGKLIIK